MFLKIGTIALGTLFSLSAQAVTCKDAGQGWTTIPAKMKTAAVCQSVGHGYAAYPKANIKAGTVTAIDEHQPGLVTIFFKEMGPLAVDWRGKAKPKLAANAEIIVFLDQKNRVLHHVSVVHTKDDQY